MKYTSITFVFLLLLEISPFPVAFAKNKEKVIVISERVGEVIDAEERERFGLWPEIKGFKSAIFLQLPDGSYVAEITYEENGEEKKARTPQNEIAIKSLKSNIKKISKGKMQPVYSADEGKAEEEKYESHSKGEMVRISEKVGASIDLKERNEYGLFTNFPNFKRATFYRRKEGGYLIEIQTKKEMLVSVVLDTAMLLILNDYIERYEEVQANREPFESKWSIISYDGQGIPITNYEILKFHKKGQGHGWGCGCTIGGSALGFAVGAMIVFGQSFAHMDSGEPVSSGPVYIGLVIGAVGGYLIGNSIEKERIDKGHIVRQIKELRTPR